MIPASRQQRRVLEVLAAWPEPGCGSSVELAGAAGLPAPEVRHALVAMFSLRWVERTAVDGDRVVWTITPRGRVKAQGR